jgi:hypothetical protein
MLDYYAGNTYDEEDTGRFGGNGSSRGARSGEMQVRTLNYHHAPPLSLACQHLTTYCLAAGTLCNKAWPDRCLFFSLLLGEAGLQLNERNHATGVLAMNPLWYVLSCAAGVCVQFDASMRLTADDFEDTRKAAMGAVRVPQHVIQLLADLRTYLQVGHPFADRGATGAVVVVKIILGSGVVGSSAVRFGIWE